MKVKGYLGLAMAGLLAASVVPAGRAIAQEDKDFQSTINSTVRIRGDTSLRSATGWVIEPMDKKNRAGAAVVVTSLNAIEVDGVVYRKIWVYNPENGKPLEATLLGKDEDRNLAFLEVKDLTLPALPIASDSPKMGNDSWSFGYNLESDLSEDKMAADASLKSGKLSRELRGPISSEARAPIDELEHDSALLPGFEGGPLVDRCSRVIGMNIKSAGITVPRMLLLIRPQASTMDALKFNEIVKAANQFGVKYTAAGTSCGGDSSASVVPTKVGVDNAAAPVTPPTPTPTPSAGLIDTIKANPLLILLGVLGIVAIAFGVYMLSRRDGASEEPPVAPRAPSLAPSRPTELPDSQTTVAGGTSIVQPTKLVETGPILRLNGRGFGGELIDLSFSAGALKLKTASLGVGSAADARIPDNRPQHLVSRLHAKLASDGESFTIEDTNSTNGTFVNGRRLSSGVATPLINGDRVTFGDVETLVSVD